MPSIRVFVFPYTNPDTVVAEFCMSLYSKFSQLWEPEEFSLPIPLPPEKVKERIQQYVQQGRDYFNCDFEISFLSEYVFSVVARKSPFSDNDTVSSLVATCTLHPKEGESILHVLVEPITKFFYVVSAGMVCIAIILVIQQTITTGELWASLLYLLLPIGFVALLGIILVRAKYHVRTALSTMVKSIQRR